MEQDMRFARRLYAAKAEFVAIRYHASCRFAIRKAPRCGTMVPPKMERLYGLAVGADIIRPPCAVLPPRRGDAGNPSISPPGGTQVAPTAWDDSFPPNSTAGGDLCVAPPTRRIKQYSEISRRSNGGNSRTTHRSRRTRAYLPSSAAGNWWFPEAFRPG